VLQLEDHTTENVSFQIDDQIALLINAWCELLVLSCCFRSVRCPPGVVRLSAGLELDAEAAERAAAATGAAGSGDDDASSAAGAGRFVARMAGFTDQLRRLGVDHFEYVAMKVIVLLTSGEFTFPAHRQRERMQVRGPSSRSSARIAPLPEPCFLIPAVTEGRERLPLSLSPFLPHPSRGCSPPRANPMLDIRRRERPQSSVRACLLLRAQYIFWASIPSSLSAQ